MSIPTSRLWTITGLIILLIATPFFDIFLSRLLHGLGEGGMDRILAFLCSWPFYVVLFITPLFWTKAGRHHVYAKVLISIIIAYLVTFLLKEIFQVVRPFALFGWTPLESFTDFGFPSSHATTAFVLLPLVKAYGSRTQHLAWLAFGVLIALSRVVLGMHFGSDVLAGVLLGLSLGHMAVQSERLIPALRKFDGGNEVLRQVVHIVFGVLIVILVRSFLLSPVVLLVMAIGGGLVVILQKHRRLSILERMITSFERPTDASVFPGRGIFFYLLGSWIVLLLFPIDIAFAAIIILALGDGTASLVGKFFGSTRIGYNPHKTWEGTLAAIMVATVAAGLFLPWWVALVAASLTMLVETLPLRIGKVPLDDNLVLPFVAATVIVLVSPMLSWVSA